MPALNPDDAVPRAVGRIHSRLLPGERVELSLPGSLRAGRRGGSRWRPEFFFGGAVRHLHAIVLTNARLLVVPFSARLAARDDRWFDVQLDRRTLRAQPARPLGRHVAVPLETGLGQRVLVVPGPSSGAAEALVRALSRA